MVLLTIPYNKLFSTCLSGGCLRKPRGVFRQEVPITLFPTSRLWYFKFYPKCHIWRWDWTCWSERYNLNHSSYFIWDSKVFLNKHSVSLLFIILIQERAFEIDSKLQKFVFDDFRNIIECIFLSQGRHYDLFPVFTFIRCRLVFDWF